MIIRAATFKRWMRANFNRSQLSDMVRHGANTGWAGLTYYTDTSALYARYKEEIWDLLYEDAEAQGVTIPRLIGDLSYDPSTVQEFEGLLVQYAAERTASEITDGERG